MLSQNVRPFNRHQASVLPAVTLGLLLGLGSPWVQRATAQCQVTGNYTINCGGVVYRAVDDECVHYVDLAAHNASHPGVPLPDLKKTVPDNYDPQSIPTPVVVELTDYVDCTQTDHNFTDEAIFPAYAANHASRLMTISGKTFRVTGAPDDGFATYYYSYDLATGGTAGQPHLLMAELSNDQERYTSLQIHHPEGIVVSPGQPWLPPYTSEPTINPWGDPWYNLNFPRAEEGCVFGPDVGVDVYTGRELPIDNKPFNSTLIFHAKTATARVVVSSTGCTLNRSATDGGAVSRMWLFEFVDSMTDRYPQPVLPADPAQRRRIGIYMTHPWYFYAHYGTPVRLLSQRQDSLRRMVRHFKYAGCNYLVFNAINGADRSVKAWYDGSAYFDWNSAGDLVAELPPICQAEGVDLVPIITSLVRPTYNGGISWSNSSYQTGTDGNYVQAFGSNTLDPLRPEVQQYTKNLLTEIANRCSSSPSVRGLGIRVNGKIGTCYAADQDGTSGAKLAGYSSWDLQQFKADTGSSVPTSSPGAAYTWLVNHPTDWEAWLNWRCTRTRTFWLACRDLIRTYRSDWTFYVQCDLPSETPGTNIEWPATTPRDLLRASGYDPDMFANDTGIVISRGMMVAEDRFYVSTRWGSPWGSNHQNYRLFHFAPGLAEMYRTATGKACEFYQNYWEEVDNPYYEFGSPGDPNGFFRTNTPAAPGQAFYEGATMSVRRQDPDTMTWLGWNRPTLGHESDLRKFATAFRSLPAITPTAFAGTLEPVNSAIVARWHGDRLAVINDTTNSATITLHFSQAVPVGDELKDVVTGRKLVATTQLERQNVSFAAQAYSLNVFLYTPATGPVADFTTGPLPSDAPLTVQFYDASARVTNVTNYQWSFGDGSPTGSGPQPTHTYATFGTYQVTLTITANEGTFNATKPITLVPSPPIVSAEAPARGSSVSRLASVSVTFSEPVTGVQASGLNVNNSPATTVTGSGAGPYLFAGYAAPATGTVNVSLATGSIADLGGTAFAGDQWTYTLVGPPVPGVDNPSFEDSGGSYNGWQIVHVSGEWPDNPPLTNTNEWGVVTPYGTHFGGKITSGLTMDFYLGQVVGVTQFDARSTQADWQLASYAQLQCTQDNLPNPTGVHLVWEVGWKDDGSEPADIMSCDHYQTIANIDGTAAENDRSFHAVNGSGSITGVTGLRGVAVRAHLYNSGNWWWTFGNIDNVSFVITAQLPPTVPGDMDGDGDVDPADVTLFRSCMSGPQVTVSSGCNRADMDGDGDADQSDFGILQRCYSGIGAPANANCAN